MIRTLVYILFMIKVQLLILVHQVNNVKVDFDHQDNHKTYTVEAKAGDFIIGEVGRIDVNNGQTLEVGPSLKLSPI